MEKNVERSKEYKEGYIDGLGAMKRHCMTLIKENIMSADGDVERRLLEKIGETL